MTFTHEYLIKNEDGTFEHEEYTSAFEIANHVCCYYRFGEDIIPQDVLNDLEQASGPVRFGDDEDYIWVRELDEVRYKDEYGEFRTADEMQDIEEVTATHSRINGEWWQSVDRNSQVSA